MCQYLRYSNANYYLQCNKTYVCPLLRDMYVYIYIYAAFFVCNNATVCTRNMCVSV